MIPESLQLSDLAKTFKPGVYRHYRGELYNAMFVAKHSEDHQQEFVIYQSLEHGYICARPVEMFLEKIEVDGKTIQRFQFIKSHGMSNL